VKRGDLVTTHPKVENSIMIENLMCFDVNEFSPPKGVNSLNPGEIGMVLEFRDLPPGTYEDPEDSMMVRILAKGVIGWCTLRSLEVIS